MLTQKAELESLEQQRGGVDRESAMLAEEVWGCLEILELKVCSVLIAANRFCASRLKLDSESHVMSNSNPFRF
jgi:hypothetical protein